jgi:hypothetical protein
MIETSQYAFSRVSATSSLLDQLMYVFGVMIAYHQRDVGLARALIREVTIPVGAEGRDHLQVLMQFIYRGIAQLIADGQDAGRLRTSVDPRVAAETLFATYYLGLIGWLGGAVTRKRFAEQLRTRLSVVIEGIAVPPARRPAARKPKP